ncbi:subtilase family protein [Striga asiatica]|uniref:Subtilase family protein n=1 Tax=Striga asiatica TaxID=4170 RepID=A0A5A7PAR1_STRAF|nr:subtilase family protein [Striga asiatica]
MGHILGHVVLFLTLSLAFVHPHDEDVKTYIIRVQNNKKPSVFPEAQHWYEATLQSLEDSNPSKPQNSKLVHVYKTVFHGFSAKLTTRQAQQLQECDPNNTRVAVPLLNEFDYGSGVIIGFLDSGIKPDHPSFNDSGLGPLPANKKWKGECAVKGVKGFLCNKKVIGARSFIEGTGVSHGTHTASIAAGRAVENVFYSENAFGTAVGIVPKARIAIYKVCDDDGGCPGNAILAGFDKAVDDGVDIISISIGDFLPRKFDTDLLAIGAFGAMERGVSVIASAGNSGPTGRSVSNMAPWLTSVAAGTIDRVFSADLVLEDGTRIHGSSLYSGPPMDTSSFLPLADGEDCLSLDQRFSGKIVVCFPEDVSNATDNVRNAGGAGVVAIYMDLSAKQFSIPGLVITESDGSKIYDLINATRNTVIKATMEFYGVELGVEPAPAVASFSSRGPNPLSSYVMKPDVLAPGVNILAAWPEGVEFKILSGTSMACPHVSGLSALLKGAHPEWSPAMIRSAIMTTAYTQANDRKPIINDHDGTKSTTSDMGAGHIDPSKAHDPGLVYDINPQGYVDFLCALGYITYGYNCTEGVKQWDLNYPAISIGFNDTNRGITVKRTVTNVGEDDATYTVTVTNPEGVYLTVNPMRMDFTSKGEKQNYSVTITATGFPGDVDGKIVWSDGKRQVVSPVVIVRTHN